LPTLFADSRIASPAEIKVSIMEITALPPGLHSAGRILPPSQHGKRTAESERVKVDGKLFARNGHPFRIQGVTYGPFRPSPEGEPFPPVDQLLDDFARMQGIGINSIRTYHVPPEWLLDVADEQRMSVFVDIPWAKHLCFLGSDEHQQEARGAVRAAAERGRKHPCILAYSVANEIPPNIVRWYGARRVERFIQELMDVARQADPDGLFTYANYPSTEYLDLSFLDFATFNVYLHELATFRRYLIRLQNLVGDKPLVLGELGMDTLRQGEMHQAEFLKGHIGETTLMGLAGTFVFSWTDDWHTGGHSIDNWAFGITYADRTPKASFHALREVFESAPAEMLHHPPRVSVIVCTYNGGRTLHQCLTSLLKLDYPSYEVIVVNDGSTDDTAKIAASFPGIRVIHQPNQGLSVARNVGLRAATGSIIAYTDDDCFADRNWLTHLVYHFDRCDAVAVGGPNLTPQDGWLAACIAACPGQPTHVLESDQVAEHIPGCNMAFRRAGLEAINGFDAQYRKAGDDVDVCWRLQQAGYWITFAPGAFVWHHRRQNPRAYLKQQAGYGEAEALLRFKHPDRFNGRGDGKWRGVLYGNSSQGLRLDEDIIYRGTFGTGLFQCLYQPGPAYWAMFPSTLEWHLAVAIVALSAFFSPVAWIAVGVMLALSLGVAVLQGYQARLPAQHGGFLSRLLVTAMCYVQPLVRSWSRYRTRLLAYRAPQADPAFPKDRHKQLPLTGRRSTAYWTDQGCDRTELLGHVVGYLNEHGWGKTVDSGWEDWDLEIHCHPWTVLQVCTAQEDHGGQKRLLRVRYRLRLGGYTKTLLGVSLLGGLAALLAWSWPIAAGAGVLLTLGAALWWRGTRRAAEAISVIDGIARRLQLLPCGAPAARVGVPASAGDLPPAEAGTPALVTYQER
jgi:GT2 family glycosyltransferase